MLDNSKILGNYMLNKFPLKQLKFDMYDIHNIYEQIPSLFFFLQDLPNKEKIYLQIFNSITLFNGKLKWILCQVKPSKKSYAIIPIIALKNYSIDIFSSYETLSKDEMKSLYNYTNICNKAIIDIPNLLLHMRKTFGE